MKRTIIDNARTASEAWAKLSKADQKKLKRYFHLRPTQSGITIVSTMSFLPMRGLTVKPGQIDEALNFLIKNFNKYTQVDQDKAKEILINQGSKFYFKSRSGVSVLEENIQALMINTMSEDKNLSRALNLRNNIQFIASELRFEMKAQRIDIVGYDSEDLYIFELKKARTSKISQLQSYIDYYNDPKIREFLTEVLKNYPIYPVKGFNNIFGCMVMEYCENASARKKLIAQAKPHKVLFYEPSIKYAK
jgi:hypothetical protein